MPQIITFLVTEAEGGISLLVRQWIVARCSADIPASAQCRAIGCACEPVYFAHAAMWFIESHFGFTSDRPRSSDDASSLERGGGGHPWQSRSFSGSTVSFLSEEGQAPIAHLVQDVNDAAATHALALLPRQVQLREEPRPLSKELSGALLRAAPRFADALVGVGRSLASVPRLDRGERLRTGLQEITLQMLPDDATYLPVQAAPGSDGCCHHRVFTIHAEESLTFNTASHHIPFLVCIEVIDYELAERESQEEDNSRVAETSAWLGQERRDHPHTCRFNAERSRANSWDGNEKRQGSAGDDRLKNEDVSPGLGQWSSTSKELGQTSMSRAKVRAVTCPNDLSPADISASMPPPPIVDEDDEGKVGTFDQHARPSLLFKERWAEKETRLRRESPIGGEPGWRLLPFIVKSNDDLRHEELVAQVRWKHWRRVTNSYTNL